MCDIFVALPNSTTDGSLIFAKNSDREPNECHDLLLIAHASHPPGSKVRCTYVEIPQAAETNTVLLSKPAWIWGAEMGANEHGLIIGNTAVFTKLPAAKEPGLIGMDFLRLALERAATARQALQVITDLLGAYGQSGNCGFSHGLYYSNSYLMADPHEAWLLETAGGGWAAEQVKGVRSISNAITIGEVWDLASPGLVEVARKRGWCKPGQEFNFAHCYSDLVYTNFSDARPRQCRTTNLLKEGAVNLESAMAYLRDHGATEKGWSPDRGITGMRVCAHAGFGPIRNSQTTGSMVSQIKPGEAAASITHWLTGASAPCTALFKPVWMESELPEMGEPGVRDYQPDHPWWQHEKLHRLVLQDYTHRLGVYEGERDDLERQFIQGASQCSPADRRQFTASCFRQAAEATQRWVELVSRQPLQRRNSYLYSIAWDGFNKQAKM